MEEYWILLISVSIEIVMILCFIFLNCICFSSPRQILIDYSECSFQFAIRFGLLNFGEVIYFYFHSGFFIQAAIFFLENKFWFPPCGIWDQTPGPGISWQVFTLRHSDPNYIQFLFVEFYSYLFVLFWEKFCRLGKPRNS